MTEAFLHFCAKIVLPLAEPLHWSACRCQDVSWGQGLCFVLDSH